MKTLKSWLLLFAIVAMVISSCSSNTSVVSPTDITFAPTTKLPTATSIFTPELTNTPTVVPTNTPTTIISKTRVNLSPELYLDENSSPDNLGELNYPDYFNFYNDVGNGYLYHFGNEEWVIAQSETRIVPFKDVDTTRHVEGELRQYYVQLWKDGKLVYSLPINFGDHPHAFLRYENHWIFSFGDDWDNQGWIVQDGIILNDLHDYDTAFSLFLLDGKPFFFFQRGDQFGISFNDQEMLLPYPNISYGPICCEGGGRGAWNPRAANRAVGFWVWWGDNEYQYNEYRYIEIGLQ